jgi:hypothetical protein
MMMNNMMVSTTFPKIAPFLPKSLLVDILSKNLNLSAKVGKNV